MVGRRADGYHLLDTIMLPVSLYDEIDIRKMRAANDQKTARPERSKLTCRSSHRCRRVKTISLYQARVCCSPERKAYSAADRDSNSARTFRWAPVWAVAARDAAATLVGLNRLIQAAACQLKQLEKIASALGADVPFFIRGRPARARGIGERLTPAARKCRDCGRDRLPGFPGIDRVGVWKSGSKVDKR